MLPDERKKFRWVTASVAPAACGFFSRPQAWRRGMGLEAFAGNAWTDWGTEHEPDAVFAYECITGRIPRDTGENQRFYVHPCHYWLGATPDGLLGDQGVLEAKCPQKMYEGVPPYYHIQTQVQLEVLDRLTCDFVAWTPEETRIWRVARSREFYRSVHPLLIAFFRALRDFNEPPRFKRKPTFNFDLIHTERIH